SPRCIISGDEEVLVDALAPLRLLGLRIEHADDAVGIAYRRDFRIGDDDGGIGMSHRQDCTALDAGGTVADHPVESLLELADDAPHPFLGEGVLVAGLRSE